MSAFPPEADIRQRVEHVCIVPKADSAGQPLADASPHAISVRGPVDLIGSPLPCVRSGKGTNPAADQRSLATSSHCTHDGPSSRTK